MPTHTPSPHRFRAPSSTAPKAKPQSSLRHGHIAHAEEHTPKPALSERNLDTPRATPARRFVRAPGKKATVNAPSKAATKDGIAKSSAEGNGNHGHIQPTPGPQTPFSRPRAALARKLNRVESIEEGEGHSPEKSVQPRHNANIESGSDDEDMNSVHAEEEDSQDAAEDDEEHELLFTPAPAPRKRRRISTHIHARSTSSTSILISSHHTSPVKHEQPRPREGAASVAPSLTSATNTASSHRFILQPPRARPQTPASVPLAETPNHAHIFTTKPPIPSTPSQSHHNNRPAFVLPQPASPPENVRPLPDTFSPQRKNQKYVPGGMASTVASWIIDVAGTGFSGQQGFGGAREDGIRLKVRVGSVRNGYGSNEDESTEVEGFAGGALFLRQEADRGDRQRGVVLLGQAGRGTTNKKVKEGALVGIRSPCWEIDVGGEKWIVGIDWVVL